MVQIIIGIPTAAHVFILRIPHQADLEDPGVLTVLLLRMAVEQIIIGIVITVLADRLQQPLRLVHIQQRGAK